MKKLISLILIIILLIGFIFIIVKEFDKQNTLQGDYEIIEVSVHSGDTLWNIGKKYCSDKDDIRLWIFEVNKLNNTDSNLQVGQVLKIYCEK